MLAIVYSTDGSVRRWFTSCGEDIDVQSLSGYVEDGLADPTDQILYSDVEPNHTDAWVDITAEYPVLTTRVPVKTPDEIKAEMVKQVQRRLDSFAQARGYDNILSAATYATSSVPAFAAEGQYAVEARDQMWSALYTILAEVMSGARLMPESFVDIEDDLPTLEWPDGSN